MDTHIYLLNYTLFSSFFPLNIHYLAQPQVLPVEVEKHSLAVLQDLLL